MSNEVYKTARERLRVFIDYIAIPGRSAAEKPGFSDAVLEEAFRKTLSELPPHRAAYLAHALRVLAGYCDDRATIATADPLTGVDPVEAERILGPADEYNTYDRPPPLAKKIPLDYQGLNGSVSSAFDQRPTLHGILISASIPYRKFVDVSKRTIGHGYIRKLTHYLVHQADHPRAVKAIHVAMAAYRAELDRRAKAEAERDAKLGRERAAYDISSPSARIEHYEAARMAAAANEPGEWLTKVFDTVKDRPQEGSAATIMDAYGAPVFQFEADPTAALPDSPCKLRRGDFPPAMIVRLNAGDVVFAVKRPTRIDIARVVIDPVGLKISPGVAQQGRHLLAAVTQLDTDTLATIDTDYPGVVYNVPGL